MENKTIERTFARKKKKEKSGGYAVRLVPIFLAVLVLIVSSVLRLGPNSVISRNKRAETDCKQSILDAILVGIDKHVLK